MRSYFWGICRILWELLITKFTKVSMMTVRPLKISTLLLALALVITACSSDDDTPENTTEKSEIETTLTSNTWIITKYIDSGTDELYHYNGFEFTFGSGNVLTASNGTNTYIGTWSLTDDTDDDSPNDLDMIIFFASPEAFAELSDDWDIVSSTSSKIELLDVSGGSGEIDYLTFERN